jgi:hypothetical protein
MNMIYFSIAMLALAAVLGLIILIKWMTNKSASRGVIYSHGVVAAIGLLLIVVYSFQHQDNIPKISLGLLVLSAIGGFYMFFRDINNKMSPLAVAFVHALLAVSGFVALLLFALS